jgi:L-asparagine oxygenase
VSTITRQREPMTVDASGWSVADGQPTSARAQTARLDESFVHSAAMAGRMLPVAVDDAIAHFAAQSHRSGALLLRGVPVGALPPTPPTPSSDVDKDLSTELALLTIARRLGQPVGYVPEHGGRIVQNIVPTQADADAQTSTSSRSTLMFHTETAFHPHRPRYLLLLCLRGDANAHTTLASIHDVLDDLDARGLDARNDGGLATAMFEPRYRTAVDASFLDGRRNELGPLMPLVSGTRAEPTFVFDADLTVGVDPVAQHVVDTVRDAVARCQTSVVLEPGDLLVIDNNVAVHGRSPFTARFDGYDRWLQRSFVVADLAPSAADRDGRVITTRFGLD